jgi:hypothetical protein
MEEDTKNRGQQRQLPVGFGLILFSIGEVLFCKISFCVLGKIYAYGVSNVEGVYTSPVPLHNVSGGLEMRK